MKVEEFKEWLRNVYVSKSGKHFDERTIDSRIANCKTVENHEGDLDKHQSDDCMSSLLSRLNYPTADQRQNLPMRHRIPIDGDRRKGSATLKTAVNLYKHFCAAQQSGERRCLAPAPSPTGPKPPARDWPQWPKPTDAEALTLARIVMPYVRFLKPVIVAAVVANNERQSQEWSSAFQAHGIDPSAYLWDKSPCAFPGVRRYAGKKEITGYGKPGGQRETVFEQALRLDDNDCPKHLWSFTLRGRQFQKFGPKGYALAHLADHKKHGNRFESDFALVEGITQTDLHGLYSCPTNTAFIPSAMIRPTDFGAAMRNLLLRRAHHLYGAQCNLLPPWLRLRLDVPPGWELEEFEWAEPVGDLQGVGPFLDYRNGMIRSLLDRVNQPSPVTTGI